MKVSHEKFIVLEQLSTKPTSVYFQSGVKMITFAGRISEILNLFKIEIKTAANLCGTQTMF